MARRATAGGGGGGLRPTCRCGPQWKAGPRPPSSLQPGVGGRLPGVGGRLPVVFPPLLPAPPGGRAQSWGLGARRVWPSRCSGCSRPPKWSGRATLHYHRGFGEPCTDGRADSLAEAQTEMLGREGACWGMRQPGPVLIPTPRLCYPQSQHPLTHGQSWGAHGTWVARLPWRTLQRKGDITDQPPNVSVSPSQGKEQP